MTELTPNPNDGPAGERAEPTAAPTPRLLAAPPSPLIFTGARVVPASLLPKGPATETPPATKELLFYWCTATLLTWIVAVEQDGAVVATRWIMFLNITILCVFWPALRLSQDRVSVLLRSGRFSASDHDGPGFAPNSLAHLLRLPSKLFPKAPSAMMTVTAPVTPKLIFVDWLHLILVMQIAVWPLHFHRGWHFNQTLSIDLAYLLWSFLAAGILAVGVQVGTSFARLLAMAACILVLIGEPLLEYWSNQHWAWSISPIKIIWHLSLDSYEFEPTEAIRPFTTVGLLGLAAWAWVLVRARLK